MTLTTAFGISPEDVENVINGAGRWQKTVVPAREAMARQIGLKPTLSLEDLAAELYERLDLEEVARSALDSSTDLDGQTQGAYEEIERQLNLMDSRILTVGWLPTVSVQGEVSDDAHQSSTRLIHPAMLEALATDISELHIAGLMSAEALGQAMRNSAARFAKSDEGQRALSDLDVEEVLRGDNHGDRLLVGVFEVSAGVEDLPFIGCPEEWTEKTFARIQPFHDRGDLSIGVRPSSGWTLAADQRGTVVERLAQHEAFGAQLRDALCIATASVRDLANGWPAKELCEPPAETMERLDRLVPNHGVLALDKSSGSDQQPRG